MLLDSLSSCFSSTGKQLFVLLVSALIYFWNFSPELVGMQHEVSASNPEPATNYRRIDDSDESDAEPDVMTRSENAEQVIKGFSHS